jgi:hypothetical protein
MKKRLSMLIPLDIHQTIRIQATMHNISVTAYVLRAVLQQIKKDRDVQ